MSNTEVKVKVKKSSLAKRRVQKFCRNPMSVVAIFVILFLILASVFGPMMTGHDPLKMNIKMKYAEPSAEHLLGCDRLGRDLLSRVLIGGRWSLIIGITASLMQNLLGAALGAIAGYFGKKVDTIIVTLGEIFQLFPTTLLLIMCSAIMGKITIWFLLGMWTVFSWVGTMRTTRSNVLTVKNEPFVESCRANGISSASIMFHHIIPNITGPIILSFTMQIAHYVLSEAGLSYLGYGLDASTTPTWGNLLNVAKGMEVVLGEPIQWIAPAVCMLALTLSVAYLGDGLRDAIDATTR